MRALVRMTASGRVILDRYQLFARCWSSPDRHVNNRHCVRVNEDTPAEAFAQGVRDYSLRPMHTEVPTFQGNVRNSVKPDRR